MKRKQKAEEQNGDENKKIKRDQVNAASRDPQEDEPNNPDIALTTTINPITGKIFLWYDWLANSATTLHVTNQQEAFKTFRSLPTNKERIIGVGNIEIKATGIGNVDSYLLSMEKPM